MSTPVTERRLTVRDIRKGRGPFVCLTAYTTPVARLLDPHTDVLLVRVIRSAWFCTAWTAPCRSRWT